MTGEARRFVILLVLLIVIVSNTRSLNMQGATPTPEPQLLPITPANAHQMAIFATFQIEDEHITDMVWSPDSKILATASESGVWLNDAIHPHNSALILENSRYAKSIAISSDGKLLAVTFSGNTGLWDIATGKQLIVFKDSNAMALSPDGRLIAHAGQDYRVHVWDIQAHKEL